MLLNWFLYGYAQLSFFGYVIVVLGLTHVTIAMVTIFLHRCQSHRALDLHPIVSHFFRFWSWLTTGMITKEFVAVHRKHHAKVETADDPHSPIVQGLGYIFWFGVIAYRRSAADPETLEKYGSGTPDDWLERNVYTKHTLTGLMLMLGFDLICFGLCGLGVWLLQIYWIPFWAIGWINGVGHYFGYRNFEPNDTSTNISPIGFIVGGEELHNNHHAFPSSAKFSVRWFEFDLGYFYIRILSLLGLAKVKRLPPKKLSTAMLDKVTKLGIWQLFKLQQIRVLANYSRMVINPVFRQQKKLGLISISASGLGRFSQLKRLLVRPRGFLPEWQLKGLDSVLKDCDVLSTVYQFRAGLDKLIYNSRESKDELVDSLQAWCKAADKTGVLALQQFSKWVADAFGLLRLNSVSE